MVVITIIGILIGLLLPAVQAAREAARRASCLNNLRQVGIALHSYHAALRTFPPGGTEVGPAYPGGRMFSWCAFLLPYLEQQALYDSIRFDKRFDAAENAAPAATVLAVYLCPSSSGGNRLVQGRGATDYGGIYGERISGPNEPPKGVMLYNRAVSIDEVRDGTSNTLAVAEDSGWKDGQWICALNVFDQAYPINKAPDFENDIRSRHPGGANGTFCDGSVRFLRDSMDLKTLAAICTRAGGEVVADF